MYVCMYAWTYKCMYVCMYVCMSVCMHELLIRVILWWWGNYLVGINILCMCEKSAYTEWVSRSSIVVKIVIKIGTTLTLRISNLNSRPVCYQKTCFLEVAAKVEREKSSTSQKRKHAYIFRVRRLLHAPKIVNIYIDKWVNM